MKKQGAILIVDDTEMNRSILADMLMEEYDILEAANGAEAVSLLRTRGNEISLVLLDIVMPEMDGFEVLAMMNKYKWIGRIPVITISSETASAYIDHAYDLGASDYISRPFDEKTVQRRVRNTMMLYSKQKALEDMVAEQIVEKERNNILMVEILSNIVEFRNGESGLHVLHIRTLTDIFLRELQKVTDRYPITPTRAALAVNASALHDVGKISIPEAILNKPGRLTAEEFETMKTHSALGAQIMEDALHRHNEELLQMAYNICRWHHERWDGRGYPDGLQGDAIPIEAQVVALADVYDALTSKRVYKPAYPHAEAIRMILDGECGAFNPILIQCLRNVEARLEDELRVRSAKEVSEESILEMSSQILEGGKASSRTLNLLEQERIKYQFFASMSNEIQFEYSYQTELLTMSEWGAQRLGLSMLIETPRQNQALRQVFSLEDYNDLSRRLRAATREHPVVRAIYRLHIKGKKRWYKALARPLWSDEEQGEMVGVIGKFVDVNEEQNEMEQLKLLAKQDPLTGLNNLAYARGLMREALAEGGRQYALVLADIDGFRRMNQEHGRAFGDALLCRIGDALRQCGGPGDVAARAGGDELVLLMRVEDDAAAKVEQVFRRLCCEFRGSRLSVSMGIARAPEDGEEFDALFHAAERALFAAKGQGKGCYCFYDRSMERLLSVLSPMDC